MSPNVPLGAAMMHSALLMLMGVALALNVIWRRSTRRISLGDGGDPGLALAIRVHANFLENAPLAIAAYVLLALAGNSAGFIHVLGAVFLAGRVAHAAGLSQHQGTGLGRVLGAFASNVVLVVAAIRLLIGSLG
jgi:uncharacterized membrane protein YecN with MAPEG domain